MDSRTGEIGEYATIYKKILDDGRDPAEDMVMVEGPPAALQRVSSAVAAHRPNRKARRKAQRAARRRNR